MLRRLGPPLAAFLLAQGFFALAAWSAGLRFFDPATWTRWDSAYYLELAQQGYTLFPCGPQDHYPPGALCGNSGWFAGYSWLIRALAPLLGVPQAAQVIVLAAHLLCLIALWNLLLEQRGLFALALAAFFPGQIYLRALFPMAPLLFCIVLCLGLCQRQRFGLALLPAFATGALYPVGPVLAPVLAVWALLEKRRGAVLVAAAVLAGLGVIALAMHAGTGHFDAYTLLHARDHQGLHQPLDTLLSRLKPLVNARYRNEKGLWSGLQTLLVLALVISIAVKARHGSRLLLLYAGAAWLFPLLAGGQTSLYRSELVLLPCVALARDLPRPWLATLVAAAALLCWPMARLFFSGVLV